MALAGGALAGRGAALFGRLLVGRAASVQLAPHPQRSAHFDRLESAGRLLHQIRRGRFALLRTSEESATDLLALLFFGLPAKIITVISVKYPASYPSLGD